ncbi:sensor domain-containing diguanylate cyclase [Butyrivibrio sp. NC3005]|uniref:sensor domain-containing diguanylate cyclase n=1 Tax=Butyrivibrio sp. NC3005 TaxID=1280685 RepID=UPI0003F7B08B|nr:sensor domain-containing diguanylate cyclase [Butyrivibrio sp. NC3005]
MENKFRIIQLKMVALFVGTVLGTSAFLSFILISRSSLTLRKNASNLIAANTRQIELNIDNYLESIERAASLLYSDENYYSYDPVVDELDEYENIQKKKLIEDKIRNLGLLNNYSDFGIIYSNNQFVGWISQVTQQMFLDEDLYINFEKILKSSSYKSKNNSNGSAWVFGVSGNEDRAYYVKRFNEHALIVVSFYTRELQNVFKFPEQLEGMTVRLTDEKKKIVFSSDSTEIGEIIPSNISEILDDRSNISIMNKKLLVTSNTCQNNWKVICSIPSYVVIKDNVKLQSSVIMMIIILVAMFIVIGLLAYRRVNKSAESFVDSLARQAVSDQMTGLLNKTSFQEAVENCLQDEDKRKKAVFLMIDLDNFKQVNDKLGHLVGDQAIRKFASILKNVYDGKDFYIGRLGGDEFGVFCVLDIVEESEAKDEIMPYLEEFRTIFNSSFSMEQDICGLSYSCGAVKAQKQDSRYSFIYQKADKLLYESKNTGKGKDTLLFPEV